MNDERLKITCIGGPTALLAWGSLRLLTDPTFDPAGEEYRPGPYTLRKTSGPAIPPEALGRVDLVLLSHDHHFDNLDRAGREFLSRAKRVITTPAAAERLGSVAIGLAPWQSVGIATPEGRLLRVTATPARHGPAEHDRGPVTGFVLAYRNAPDDAVYVSGDTVWFNGVAQVARHFRVTTALLFMGAARVPEAGPWHLTLTADDGVKAARAFPEAAIVPLHYEGWVHDTESRDDIARAFAKAGLADRLFWGEPGRELVVPALRSQAEPFGRRKAV